MKNSVILSKISIKDIPDILQIAKESGLCAWSANDLEIEIKRTDSLLIIAQMEAQTIGFIVARLIMSNSCIEILNLAVKDSFRLKGVGKTFLEEVCGVARENHLHKIWLEVRESNVPAITFYKKNGFSINGQRKNFYTQPLENAYLMELDLQGFFQHSISKNKKICI